MTRLYLTAENVRRYVDTMVIPSLGLRSGVVKRAVEVRSHTYVNWIFHVVVETDDGDVSLYLRQGRHYTKARPEVQIDPGRIAVEARVWRDPLSSVRPL